MRVCIICFLCLMAYGSIAQKPQYPKDFVFPVNSSAAYLSGNMGEIRSGHFHAGLDIVEKESTPILASAAGYVSRIKVSSGGYGNVVYVTHPSTNHITVYAHLSKFSGKIAKYVRHKQYEQESFEVHLFPAPDEINIEAGETIGAMGNTGFSFGTHLHYEIRTINEHVLNPLLFFKNIQKDLIAPLATWLAVVPLEPGARINGKYERLQIKLQRSAAGIYTVPQRIEASGKIGFEIVTYDLANGRSNTYATTQIKVKANDQLLYEHTLGGYSMFWEYCLNTFINYKTLKKTSINFQRCYIADGNRLGVANPDYPGELNLNTDQNISISLADVEGNTSVINFNVFYAAPSKAAFKPDLSGTAPVLQYDFEENTLLVKARGVRKNGDKMWVKLPGDSTQSVDLAHMEGNQAVYIWDLRQGLPQQVRVDMKSLVFPEQKIPSETNYIHDDGLLRIHFPKGSLPDTSFFKISSMGKLIRIGHYNTPLVQEIEIMYRYKKAGVKVSSQTVVYALSADKQFEKATFTDSTLSFKTRNLGDFVLETDALAPAVRLLGKNPQRVSLAISDSQSGIKAFKATLDGKFILMLYEKKSNLLWSDPDWGNPLKGRFRLEVTDRAGNQKVFETVL